MDKKGRMTKKCVNPLMSEKKGDKKSFRTGRKGIFWDFPAVSFVASLQVQQVRIADPLRGLLAFWF